MMKNYLFLTTIVFFCFLTNVYAENGHVDLKFLSENVSSVNSTLNSSTTQNLSGFGIEVYKKFKKESDGENNVSYIDNYIEKSSREKKLEEKLYKERQKGAKPKTIEMWENRLSKEREKRNRLMAKRRDSEDSKIGVGLILGFKYLDGYAETTAVENYSVQTNSLEIGLRISW